MVVMRNAMVMLHDMHMRGLPKGCMDVRVRVLVPRGYHLHGVSSLLLPLASNVPLALHLLSGLLPLHKTLAFQLGLMCTRSAARSSWLLASRA